MKYICCVFLIISTILEAVTASKILVVTPMGSYSHYLLTYKLVRELADRGHEVTFINAYPHEKPIKNLNEISVEKVRKANWGGSKILYPFGKKSYISALLTVASYSSIYTEKILKVKEVQELLKSNRTFDLVILTHSLNEAMFIFPYKFNCPLVVLEPLHTTILSNHLFANPSPSSYVSNYLSSFGTHMTFWERLRNVYYDVVGEIILHYVMLPGQDAALKRSVPGAPSLWNIMYNASLMLLTSHISIKSPVPLQPAIKEIGGFHIEATKPLPMDLKEFLDNAKNGAVYFSMGSSLKSVDLTQERKHAILNVFSKLKQKILWKFETDLPEKPKNVKIHNWFPQQDILAHPNILVFISHGGLLSITEAIHHGVPILCMPVFWDQRRNCKDAERMGFGLTVHLEELTNENFRLALYKLINNSKYRENSKIRSKVMHDQPMKQMDEAVFWIEYVIRHKGAPHLRSPGLDLKWHQIYLIDIVLFLAFMSLLCLVVVCYLFRCIFGKRREVKNIKKE